MWLSLAFLSAALLGFYDFFKKISLNHNAVIPVLFLNTFFSSLFFVPLVIISYISPEWMKETVLYIRPIEWRSQFFLLLKAIIVLSSWLFTYFAMKHLPITITGPIRATQPILVLLGALVIFGERLNFHQWIGVSIAIFSFYLLSISGKKEGIHFKNNKWILYTVMATITGAMSGLYDKYLLKSFDPMTVQVWYTFYQFAIMGIILLVLWVPQRQQSTPFEWRWSILFISLFLCLADFVYFYALSNQDSLISVVSMVRRSGVVVSFVCGAIFLHEKNIKTKALDMILVLLGMFFLYLGTK
ncbi:MAG: DMT family transporter [Bacteroidales bacterium]|nr:DMT family transporter [Bacteroidales bacterium]